MLINGYVCDSGGLLCTDAAQVPVGVYLHVYATVAWPWFGLSVYVWC